MKTYTKKQYIDMGATDFTPAVKPHWWKSFTYPMRRCSCLTFIKPDDQKARAYEACLLCFGHGAQPIDLTELM